MADKLKIYACSGVGDTAQEQQQPMSEYWMDNTNSIYNTQAVNSLLASINAAWANAMYLNSLTIEQRIEQLNKVDFYVVCLEAAQRYKDNYNKLHYAGAVICNMVAKGMFAFDSFEENERNAHLDNLLSYADEAYNNGSGAAYNNTFAEWWKANVEDLNKVGLNPEQQNAVMEAVNGIAATTNLPNDPQKLLNEAGSYFLYLYMTDAQLRKLPHIFKEKKQYQKKVYNYNLSNMISICGSQKAVDNIIYQKIVKQLGMTPEQACAEIVKNGGKGTAGVGIATEVILAVISALASIIIAAVNALVNKSSAASTTHSIYQKPTQADITNGCPDTTDDDGSRTPDFMSFIPYVAIGVAAYALLKD